MATNCDHLWAFEPDLVQICRKCDVFKFVVDEKALNARVERLEGALRELAEEVWPLQADAELGTPENGTTITSTVLGATILEARAALEQGT